MLHWLQGSQWQNMVNSWMGRVVRPYAEKAKWKDPNLPTKWLQELFDKWVAVALKRKRLLTWN